MSELKAYCPYANRDGFYHKSEADKVIADLEMKLARAQLVLRLNEPKALYSDLEIMGRLRHEIDVVARRERHHKHKQCLAMAMWCKFYADSLRVKRNQCRYDEAELAETYYIRCRRYRRWCKVWMELAEKFKEAK